MKANLRSRNGYSIIFVERETRQEYQKEKASSFVLLPAFAFIILNPMLS
ncbi:hypothetical protein [Terrimonas sp.]|nr:hypothetical protein [Terrimonas sp.]